MKNTLVKIAAAALFAIALPASAAVPNWNAAGSYVISMSYSGSDYAHDLVLTQDSNGALDGHGGSPAGANTYTWDITSGTVSGDSIDFTANYTATADAVTPQTTMHVSGTIASDGTMSGTWDDNYQGGSRSGTWESTSGTADALPGTSASLSAEDFGVVNYDTGLGFLKGYTAGFGLTDATFAGAQSVVVKLYAGSTLLQTNTATAKVGTDITGSQISSPFDVSGTFDYGTDGYWTNVRESQYGQSTPATKVVATVTLEDDTVVTAENTNLSGDPTTIYPPGTPGTTTASSTGSISGKVYNDLNRNEKKNANEPGLAGFTIKLYDRAGWSGRGHRAAYATTVTDANGNYTFANLPDGTYSIEEIIQKGWNQVTRDYRSVKIQNGADIVNRDFGNVPKKKANWRWSWDGHKFSWE